MTLHELLAEIGRAGAVASQACRRAVIERFQATLEDGKPKTIEVDMGAEEPLQVPLAALLPMHTLDLDHLEVSFETEVSIPKNGPGRSSNNQVLTEEIPAAELAVDMKKGLGKQSTHFTVKAVFKMGEPPETVEALRDHLTQLVRQKLQE
mgnify:CR=1 FL=1